MRANYRLFCWIVLAGGLGGVTCVGQGKDPNAVWKKAGADEGLRQAFDRMIYRLEDSGPGRYQGVNPAERLTLEFNSDEARLKHPQGDVALRLTGYGYGGRLRTPLKAKPAASGNRVEYRRGELSEWYVNDSRGLEQGFTLARRPPASRVGEPLVIALEVAGELRPELVAQGDAVLLRSSKGAVLRYAGLRAWDARGRALASRLQVGEREVRLVVEDHGAEYPLLVDPVWTQEAELTASDGAAYDFFGGVAVSGDTAVVATPYKTIGSKSNQGAAYVFVRSGATWSQEAELTASDGAAGDNFGWSVAVSGDTAVVGAPGLIGPSVPGRAYVFVRSGTTWSQQQRLTASDGAAGDFFGFSVAVSGDTAVVGAIQKTIGSNILQGAAYVFVRSGTTWSQQQRLTASDGAARDYFGTPVSVSGDTAVVGATYKTIGSNQNQGAAYVFVRSGATWSQQQELTASDGATNDYFGASSLSGDTAVVGAYGKTIGSNPNQGAAYVFVRSGATWSQQQELTASNGAAGDNFGYSVSLSGDTAMVGAVYKTISSNPNQGAAYVFVRSGAAWSQQQKLTASDGAALDQFGYSVAVDGDTAVVGAPGKTIGSNIGQGAAYVFTETTPPTIHKAFTVASIPVGGTTNLTFTIANPNASMAFTGLAFSDTLPAGLVVGNPIAFLNMCGGTPTATVGSSTISLTGGTLGPNAQCTVVVNVRGTTAGMQNNVTGNVSSNEGGMGNTASASVNVSPSVPDVVWQNDTTRQVTVWYMGGAGGATFQGYNFLSAAGVPGWHVVAVADFNGDGVPDLVWQNDSTRQVTVWYMGGAGGAVLQGYNYLSAAGVPGWHVAAVADFNGDGMPDLVWQNDSTRQVTVWYMGGAGGAVFQGYNYLSATGVPGWHVVAAVDQNGDGAPDLVWLNDSTRQVTVWYMGGAGGAAFQGYAYLSAAGVPGWSPLN